MFCLNVYVFLNNGNILWSKVLLESFLSANCLLRFWNYKHSIKAKYKWFPLRDHLLSFLSSLLCSLITLGVLILIAEKTHRTQIIYTQGTCFIIGKGSSKTISRKEYAFKLSEDFMSKFLSIPFAGSNKTCFYLQVLNHQYCVCKASYSDLTVQFPGSIRTK